MAKISVVGDFESNTLKIKFSLSKGWVQDISISWHSIKTKRNRPNYFQINEYWMKRLLPYIAVNGSQCINSSISEKILFRYCGVCVNVVKVLHSQVVVGLSDIWKGHYCILHHFSFWKGNFLLKIFVYFSAISIGRFI